MTALCHLLTEEGVDHCCWYILFCLNHLPVLPPEDEPKLPYPHFLLQSLSKPSTPMFLQHPSHYCLDSFLLPYIEEASYFLNPSLHF